MAIGIFAALEDLEGTDLAVEPVDEVEYIQAQNDLDDTHNELEDLHETYDDADQDSSVIESVGASIPDTDESPVESTIIATEALIRKLGLPNYSLESYKNSTNKALKLSLEETVEKTNEAKKSLFKKIWEKIVAFFKKAYEFIKGLFKKKAKDVKKNVDDLEINTVEEGIKKIEAKKKSSKKTENEDESTYDFLFKSHIDKKDGKLVMETSYSNFASLLINKKDFINPSRIENNLKIIEEGFNEVTLELTKLESDLSFEHLDKLGKAKLDDTPLAELIRKSNSASFNESKDDFYYLEIVSKSELNALIDKLVGFSTKVDSSLHKVNRILDNEDNYQSAEKLVEKELPNLTGQEKENKIMEYGNKMMNGLKNYQRVFNLFNNFAKDSIRYVDWVTKILGKIEKEGK